MRAGLSWGTFDGQKLAVTARKAVHPGVQTQFGS
jgi:hypothetical protein